jgi:hypothetical protein
MVDKIGRNSHATSMRTRARVMGSYWQSRDIMIVSNQPSPNRRKGRLLCAAKTRAGGCCQVRAEPGKTRCRFHGGNSTGPKTQAGRARIAEAHDSGGSPIEREFGQSEMAAKLDLKGNYLLARTRLVTS